MDGQQQTRMSFSARLRVVTSTRHSARAAGGFSDALVKAVTQQVTTSSTGAIAVNTKVVPRICG